MHYRFEINFIVREILGPAPGIPILDIAWSDKQRYIRRYLEDYHRRHRRLPAGMQDLGSTEENHLQIGVIDFDAIRVRIDAELRRSERRNMLRSSTGDFHQRFRALRDDLIDAVVRFYESHLRLRYYWRGQWFTRAWWYYPHE